MVADSLRFARRDPASLWAANKIGIKDLDSVQDVWQINDYLDENDPPWIQQVNEANAVIEDLEGRLVTQDADHLAEITGIRNDFLGAIDKIGADNRLTLDTIQANGRRTEKRLLSLLDQQAQAFDDQFGMLSDNFSLLTEQFDALNLQYEELNEQAAEQQRLATNAARAQVPAPVASAELPQSGDNRTQEQRLGKNNSFSQLTVLSGLGAQGNPSSGLQLA